MIQVVILFLLGMAVLALMGRLRPGGPPRLGRKGGRCRACGRHRIGSGPCPCGKDT